MKQTTTTINNNRSINNTQFTHKREYYEALEELQFVQRVQALAERCILTGVNTAEAITTLSRCEFCTMHLQMVLETANINGKPPLISCYPQPITATHNCNSADALKMKPQLIVTTSGKRDHKAVCGDVQVYAETEIELVEKLKKAGVDLNDYSHDRTYGNNYPFIWVWLHK